LSEQAAHRLSTKPNELAAAVPLLRATGPDTGTLDDPGRSVRVACLVWVGLWSVGLFMNNIVSPLVSPAQPLDDAWPWPANPIAFGCILVSIILIIVSRRPDLPPSRLVDLALLYEVILALGIGVVNQWTPNATGLSWIAVLILVHPLIVPAPAAKILVASIAAASMDLVGLAVSGARGTQLPPLAVMIWAYLPNYLCVVLAMVPSRVRLRMEQHRTMARQLGSYQVGELLSRGGMGEIYRAEHRMLVRPAAVKVIRPEVLGDIDDEARRRIVQRFRREAMLTAGLRSPHTVQVYDYGVTADGTLYYVMEFLEGFDLTTLVEKFGPVPPERAVHILLQMCDSLAEAHERGLVHRDIKPSNVILSHYGSRVDLVKVLDFGLARPADLARSEAQLTGIGTVLGTPAFMAPEQIVGEPEVSPRTDLYALGCVANWLVTGRPLFEGRLPLEVLAHHVSTPPIPPSSRSELNIPESMDRIVLMCLEKDPDKRPASADAVATVLAGIKPLTPWTADRAREWWNTHTGFELAPRLSV
jgi:serine/threonine-protein kinase